LTKKRLGKGLSALIEVDEFSETVKFVNINEIEVDENQPRKFFDEEKLIKLADSIKKVGLLNPIIVKKENGKYKIISGERRFRAAKIAKLEEVPVIIKDDADEKLAFEISIIENLHREDLNPIEEAESFKKLIEEFNYTHSQVGQLIGKDRTYVTNTLRLLKLTDFVKDCLIKNLITSGHAKVLVNLDEETQNNVCKVIIEKNLSVRETERLVASLKYKPEKRENVKKVLIFEEFKDYFENVSKKLNTKIDIEVGKKEKGKLIIHFKNKEELKKIFEELLWF